MGLCKGGAFMGGMGLGMVQIHGGVWNRFMLVVSMGRPSWWTFQIFSIFVLS